MATLWISEYDEIGKDSYGSKAQVASEPSNTTQTVTYTTTTQSAAFNPSTRIIRVIADAAVYLEFGTNPTATATSLYLPSGQVEYIGIKGATIKVAAYDGTS